MDNQLLQLIFSLSFILFLIYIIGRVLLKPLRLVAKILINSLVGLLLLWAFNYVGALVGLLIPVNWLTILIAGFLGVPGLILLILLQFIVG